MVRYSTTFFQQPDGNSATDPAQEAHPLQWEEPVTGQDKGAIVLHHREVQELSEEIGWKKKVIN